MAGLKFSREHVITALRKIAISKPVMQWGPEEGKMIADILQDIAKPIIIAANKADISPKENLQKLSKIGGIITVADYELALKKASEANLVAYNSGDSDFEG